jgi:hypothetical protein
MQDLNLELGQETIHIGCVATNNWPSERAIRIKALHPVSTALPLGGYRPSLEANPPAPFREILRLAQFQFSDGDQWK